jgi:hypothetical protein
MMSIPAAAVAQDLSVCASKGYTLNSTAAAPPFGATSYTWYEDGNPLPESNSASYSIAAGARAAGEYKYVRVASNAECPAGVSSNTYTVRVLPAPDPPTMAASSSYCTSGTITATAGDGGTGILWDDGSTVTLRTVSTTGANTYRAVTTSAAGCTSSTATITVTVQLPAAVGQAPDATCGCAEGLENCGTCQPFPGMVTWTACSSSFTFTYVSLDGGQGCGQTSMQHTAAEKFCTDNGMRLPTMSELVCLCNNRASLSHTTAGDYWSSDFNSPGKPYTVHFTGTCSSGYPAYPYAGIGLVKCVK